MPRRPMPGRPTAATAELTLSCRQADRAEAGQRHPTETEKLTVSSFLPTAPYRGTRDFLPPEMSVRQQVLHRLYEVAESYG
jgi:hypothetical protein